MPRRGPGIGGWRRAVGADIPALSDFLKADEAERVGFSGRLLRGEGGEEPALRLPSPLRGSVWILDAAGGPPAISGATAVASAPAVAGALLCHPSRLAFPIFPPSSTEDRGLALLAGSFSPASALGMTADIERYEALFGFRPKASVAYRLMTLPVRPPSPGCLPPPIPYPDLVLRRATAADLDGLLPLQEAYEREEVLTPMHDFNRSACKASLARALERQLIFAAWEDGVAVAKAGTNARGFGVAQVGGVYAMPERRGRGLASALMALLLAEIRGEGKATALFVKPGNAPARALYRGLGFEDIGDYRADYFES